jgi:hypothetical protein
MAARAGGMLNHFTDRQLLEMLDMFDNQDLSMGDIAAKFQVSRNVIAGSIHRIKRDLAASEAAPFRPGTGPAVRRGNRDGDLARGWWKYRPGKVYDAGAA